MVNGIRAEHTLRWLWAAHKALIGSRAEMAQDRIIGSGLGTVALRSVTRRTQRLKLLLTAVGLVT